jgi:hypothetical protein
VHVERRRYFYDLTGWSAMILENVPGGWAAGEISDEVMQRATVRLSAKEAAKQQHALAAAAAVAAEEEEQGVPSTLQELRKRSKAAAGVAVLASSANNPVRQNNTPFVAMPFYPQNNEINLPRQARDKRWKCRDQKGGVVFFFAGGELRLAGAQAKHRLVGALHQHAPR